MRRLTITLSAAALSALLLLGAVGVAPASALASTGGETTDAPHQYIGYNYPSGWDWTSPWYGYSPYYNWGTTTWGYPYTTPYWSGYNPWPYGAYYTDPYLGSPGYPYYRYGGSYGYGYGVPGYVNQSFTYGPGGYFGPTYCMYGVTC